MPFRFDKLSPSSIFNISSFAFEFQFDDLGIDITFYPIFYANRNSTLIDTTLSNNVNNKQLRNAIFLAKTAIINTTPEFILISPLQPQGKQLTTDILYRYKNTYHTSIYTQSFNNNLQLDIPA